MKKRRLTVITRAVGPDLADCELTFLARQNINVAKAVGRHRGYEECLERGFDARTIDIGELRKAEAGLTCMSLIFNAV